MKDCTVTNCKNTSRAKKLCRMHYMRVWKHGSTDLPKCIKPEKPLCIVVGCEKKVLCKNVCSIHYERLGRLGRTYLIPGEQGRRKNYTVTAIEQRFWEKIQKTENHWLWTGAKTKLGYGSLWDYERKGHKMAHRLSWEIANGAKIPAELHIDHLCRTPSCVNPAHLEPVTRKVNAQRGIAGQRAKERGFGQKYCVRGHLRENLVLGYNGSCKICSKLNMRIRRAKIKRGKESYENI